MPTNNDAKLHAAGKLIQDAYFFLLQVPHVTTLRADIAGEFLATLRDYIAADLGASPEFIQDVFEDNARRYLYDKDTREALKYVSDKTVRLYLNGYNNGR